MGVGNPVDDWAPMSRAFYYVANYLHNIAIYTPNLLTTPPNIL